MIKTCQFELITINLEISILVELVIQNHSEVF
jgi:hypothetical protein